MSSRSTKFLVSKNLLLQDSEVHGGFFSKQEEHYYRPRTKYEGRYCFHRCLSVHTCRGGTPSQVRMGDTQFPGQDGGCPIPMSGWGYPIPRSGQGVPHSHVRTGGTTSQVWMGGTPIPGLDRRVPYSRSGWGYPIPGLDRGYPHPKSRSGWGTPPQSRDSSIASTCYAVGSMPLAFMQEDFLASDCFSWCQSFLTGFYKVIYEI